MNQPTQGPTQYSAPMPENVKAMFPKEGRYEQIGEPICGGMGVVFPARNKRLNFRVAIKRILPEFASDETIVERFTREAQSLARLKHLNIVQVIDLADDSLGPYLVMEWIDGEALSNKVQLGKGLEPELAVQWIGQLCDGLQAAHELKMTHRDIKPANILIANDARPVLIDFGLARVEVSQDSVISHTSTGAFLGTWDFVAPEQANDPRSATPLSDQWSLAATLYQMLTGYTIRARDDDLLPASLRPTILKALKPRPESRFASIADFADALRSSPERVAVPSPAAKIEPIEPIQFKVPAVGEAIEEVQISQWHKKVGEWIKDDDELVQIETDKANIEVTAPCSGFLREILKRNDELANVGEVIGIIEPADSPTTSASPIGTGEATSNAASLRSTSPERQEEDLATLLERTQASVARKHAQAKFHFKEGQFDEAARVLSDIPEHLRESELFRTATENRDKVENLQSRIRTAVHEVRLEGVREQVLELLQLQPGREDMQRLLKQLPQEAPKPQKPAPLVAPFSAEQALAAQQAWAKYLGKEVEITNSLGMQFRLIPPGTFDMGSPNSEAERLDNEYLHRVTLTKATWMGTFPVMQSNWRQVMGSNPSHFQDVTGENTGLFPVENVCWKDCQQFIDKLNLGFALENLRYRLPTEAEWEYACRAGTTTPFSFGKTLNGNQANCNGSSPYPDSSNHGPYLQRPNFTEASDAANDFGLFAMHGNVWEWCQDVYSVDNHVTSPAENPLGPTEGSPRVLRGGSWNNYPVNCRSAFRNYLAQSYKSSSVGCRILLELF